MNDVLHTTCEGDSFSYLLDVDLGVAVRIGGVFVLRRSVVITVLGGVLLGCAVASSASAQISGDDKKFLQQNSQVDMSEMALSKLALQTSGDGDVKSFAQRVQKDHERLLSSIQPLLDRAGLHPEESLDFEHQHLYDRLKGLTGEAFDKEYVKAMDKSHHEILNAFRIEIASTQDSRIKVILQAQIGVVVEATAKLDDISARMGMMPAGMQGF